LDQWESDTSENAVQKPVTIMNPCQILPIIIVWPKHGRIVSYYLPTRVFSVFCKPQLLLILFRNVLSETFIARNKPAGILKNRMLTKVGIPFFQNGSGHFLIIFPLVPTVPNSLFLLVTSFMPCNTLWLGQFPK
jgi:hypothetical protein